MTITLSLPLLCCYWLAVALAMLNVLNALGDHLLASVDDRWFVRACLLVGILSRKGVVAYAVSVERVV